MSKVPPPLPPRPIERSDDSSFTCPPSRSSSYSSDIDGKNYDRCSIPPVLPPRLSYISNDDSEHLASPNLSSADSDHLASPKLSLVESAVEPTTVRQTMAQADKPSVRGHVVMEIVENERKFLKEIKLICAVLTSGKIDCKVSLEPMLMFFDLSSSFNIAGPFD